MNGIKNHPYIMILGHRHKHLQLDLSNLNYNILEFTAIALEIAAFGYDMQYQK
jgi:hypothetical protein